MISEADFEAIRERQAVPDSPVLSVYLDVDQSKASNLNRQFEVSLKDMLRSIEAQLDEKQLQSFAADAERVQHCVSGFEPKAKGLIIFCDASENFLWARAINASTSSIGPNSSSVPCTTASGRRSDGRSSNAQMRSGSPIATTPAIPCGRSSLPRTENWASSARFCSETA